MRVAPASSVLVVVIDWMEMGAPSPMSTVPRRMRREGRRGATRLGSALMVAIDEFTEV
jgi:hypothetical protein